MTAYTNAAEIAAELNVTFTPEQEAQAEALALAVTAFIDGYTGRSWQAASPILAEVRPVVVPGPSDPYGAVARVYLACAPVETVDAVSLRSPDPNAATTPLDAGSWELIGPNGPLLLPGYGWGWLAPWRGCPALAVVDYAYRPGPPPDIHEAAKMIAAGAMQGKMATQAGSAAVAADPALAGVQSYSVGQNDISVTMSASATSGAGMSSAAGSSWAAPGSAVAAILDAYRKPVIA